MGVIDEQQIERVMGAFNFDRVLTHMLKTDWTWAPLGRVPTMMELRESARVLLHTIARHDVPEDDHEMYRSATGGFVVERRGKRLRLTFKVACADNEDW